MCPLSDLKAPVTYLLILAEVLYCILNIARNMDNYLHVALHGISKGIRVIQRQRQIQVLWEERKKC